MTAIQKARETLEAAQKRAEALHDVLFEAREAIRVTLKPDTPAEIRAIFDKLHSAIYILRGDPLQMHMAAILAALDAETEAARDVLAERERQKTVEGWTAEHDDRHRDGEMATAAAWYAINAESHDYHDMVGVADFQNSLNNHFKDEFSWCRWPWSMEWWKPTNRRRDLVKAGALILAEIERLDRLVPQESRT